MAARAFTAVEMHSCWQQGVVMLAKITFAQIADSGHLEWGKGAEEAFQRREFLIIMLKRLREPNTDEIKPLRKRIKTEVLCKNKNKTRLYYYQI